MRTTGHNPKYSQRISTVATDAVVMGHDDWRRVKKGAVHVTAAQQMTINQDSDALKKQTKRTIKDHRTTLLEAEKVKQVTQRTLATQHEMEEREVSLYVAEAKANEELDESKAMNAEMMAARVRALRDRQLEERRRNRIRDREREVADAKMLENERQRALGIYAERERALIEQRKKGGDVILAQMEEKRRNRVLENERREREINEMRVACEEAKEEERRIAEERKRRGQEFLHDCLAANVVSMRRKQRDKEREIEDARMMVEYQKEKAAREEEYEHQVKEEKARKEREISEMRKLQQRAIDTRGDEDALRARRIQEEQERKAREKELAETRRHQALRLQMDEDRKTSIALKQRRMMEIAKIEKAEFDRVQTAQMAARDKERAAYLKRQHDNEQYRKDLKTEMKANKTTRRMAPLVNLDEQHHMEEQKQDYLDRLERIRQMKISQLRDEGVPEKYLSDLQRMRFQLK